MKNHLIIILLFSTTPSLFGMDTGQGLKRDLKVAACQAQALQTLNNLEQENIKKDEQIDEFKANITTITTLLPAGVDCMVVSYIVTPSYGAAVKKEWETKLSLPFAYTYKDRNKLENEAEAYKNSNMAQPVIVFCISTIQAIAKVNRHYRACVNNNLIPIITMLRKSHCLHDEEEIGTLLKAMAGAQKPEFATWFEGVKEKLAHESCLRQLAFRGDEYLEQVKEGLMRNLSEAFNADEKKIKRVEALTIPRYIKWLLEAGAAINAKGADYCQETALLIAIRHSEDIAIQLIEQGASIIDTDDSMTTPLMQAASMGILNKGRKQLFELILSKCKDDPEYLNKQDSSGDTALMKAASAGNITGVEMLLAAGADKTIESSGGYTAFDKARTEEIAALLI